METQKTLNSQSNLGGGEKENRVGGIRLYYTDVRLYYKASHQNSMVLAAKSLQSCPTLCDPMDGSPPGSPVPGILQARTLEWVAISFSSVWKWKVKVKPLSRVRLFTTPWTAAHQAPLSMGFSRQGYLSGGPSPPPISGIGKSTGTESRCTGSIPGSSIAGEKYRH